MRKITLLFFMLLISIYASAQCINTTPFLTVTSNNDGNVQQISTCTYSVEYNTINGLIIDADYVFTAIENTPGTDVYVTITDTSNNVIANGSSPLSVSAIAVTSVRLHITADAACSGGNVCHTSSLQLTTPLSDLCFPPTGLAVSNIMDVTADLSWTAGGTNEVDYNVEVYLAGESAAGGNTPVFANANVAGTSVTATGLAPTTDYDVFITAACSGASANSSLVGPVSFTTTASCSEVSSISVSTITNIDALVSWTVGTGNDSALVEVYLTGESAAGGNTPVYSNAAASGGSDTATGLAENTDYDVYVTGQCGATSTTVQGPVSFTTACNPIVAPYTEDFETFTTSASAFTSENCWEGSGGSYYWESAPGTDTGSGLTGPNPSITTGNYFYTEASNGASGDITNLTAPLIDFSSITTPSLTFNYHMYGANMGTLDVVVNGSVEFTLTGQQQASDTDPWGLAVVDLSAYAGQTVQVVFRATSAGTYEGDMAIDNVIFDELPSCIQPGSLSVSPTSLSDATVTWSAGSTETDWTYEYGETGFVQGTGTSGTVSGTPTLSLSDLTPGATYDIYIQANCGSGDSIFIDTTWSQPNAGDTCEAPIDVETLPYTTTDDTSNYGDDYSGSAGSSGCGTTFSYLNGDDVVYSYTATADMQISIDLTPTATYSGIFVYTDCTDIGTACIAGVGNSTTNIREIDLDVTNGTTYYIVISTWAAPQSTPYTLDIYENTCSDSSATYTVINDCDVSGGFLIDVEITDMGSATSLTVSNDQNGTTFPVTSVGTIVQFGPFTNATDVIITVTDDEDSTCTYDSSALTQVACPPSNDDCAGATMLTQETEIADAASATPNPGTLEAATDSGLPAEACNGWTGTANDDVWYSFEALTTDVTITIDNTTVDIVIQAYSGSCGAFVNIGCGDSGNPEEIALTGLNVGETYYFRVYQYGTGSTVGDNFDAKVWSTQALSTEDFDKEVAFTYYPNPVNNNLNLSSQKEINNVSVYNMVGQEVYRSTPNTMTDVVDMSGLQAGAYFVKVTVGNATKTVKVIKK